jgi:hypothetical protein
MAFPLDPNNPMKIDCNERPTSIVSTLPYHITLPTILYFCWCMKQSLGSLVVVVVFGLWFWLEDSCSSFPLISSSISSNPHSSSTNRRIIIVHNHHVDTLDILPQPNRDDHIQYRMLVIFGRPGSGKTTIATRVHDKLYAAQNNNSRITLNSKIHYYLHLVDLDVCIPSWMKENFIRGVYPTHAERMDFASQACDYVDQQIQLVVNDCHHLTGNTKRTSMPDCPILYLLVSFSFVNEDLRAVYRQRFPDAIWILMDTDEVESQRRISIREGHFYPGKPKQHGSPGDDSLSSQDCQEDVFNHDEWSFAPVTFDHVRLDGSNTVEENVRRILALIEMDN